MKKNEKSAQRPTPLLLSFQFSLLSRLQPSPFHLETCSTYSTMVVALAVRELILKWHKEGHSNRAIAKLAGINDVTVGNILRHHATKGSLAPDHNKGRKRVLSKLDERHVVRMAETEPGITATAIASALSEIRGKKIKPDVVRDSLHRQQFSIHKMAVKPKLTKKAREQRMNFARQYAKMPVDFWRTVIFSDESPFHVARIRRGKYIWRRQGERLKDGMVVPAVKHGGGVVNVWACLTALGVGYMCRLDQGQDAETYITILEDELAQTQELYYKGKATIFQQDNASTHTAKKVQRWFKQNKVNVLVWPPHSPDLNPIENLWANVKQRVDERHLTIANKAGLWEAIEVEWEATPVDYCRSLVESMPHRIQAVLDAHGGYTKY